MSRIARFGEQMQPWAGLVGGAVGAGLAHQIGADSLFNDCTSSGLGTVLLAALLGLLLVALGAFGSWKIFSRKEEGTARRFVALLSLMLSALFAFAILLPVVAALVIPRCYG